MQHSIKNVSRSIRAVVFKLGTINVHHKTSKMTPACHCHDNGYAAGPVLIKTKIPRFYLKQASSTSGNLMRGWVPEVFLAQFSVSAMSLLSCLHAPVHVILMGDACCDWFTCNPRTVNETALCQRFISRLRRSCRRPSVAEAKRRIFVCRAREKTSCTQGRTMCVPS